MFVHIKKSRDLVLCGKSIFGKATEGKPTCPECLEIARANTAYAHHVESMYKDRPPTAYCPWS
jgi:hypothetical protein